MANNKILKCTYGTEGVYDSDTLWDKYEIKILPLLDIWPTAPLCDILLNKPFKKNLIKDIEKNGMYWPIMVVLTSGERLVEAKEKYKDKINPLPFWQSDPKELKKEYWSCWGGSQRIDVAIRLGYTHISSAVLPNIETAIKNQHLMRKPFEAKYYQ